MDTKSTCINCGAEIDLDELGWYEVDNGDLCLDCVAEMFDTSADE